MQIRNAFTTWRSWRNYGLALLVSVPLAWGLRTLVASYLPPDLATAANRYVREHKEGPLTEPLPQLLSDGDFVPQATEDHPLVGHSAPDFTLLDDRRVAVNLSALQEQGPVVIVFYYGYFCSHCVAQLFGLNEDLARFEELGAQVLAISADPPDLTAKRFAEFGRFGYTVVSDPGNKVAEMYQVFVPPSDGDEGVLKHATFLVGKDGRVFWAQTGNAPFLDNKTLLFELARECATSARSP